MNDPTKKTPYKCHTTPSQPVLSFSDVVTKPTQCPKGDMFCENVTGDKGSYCKYWQKDPAGQVCQGTTIPCHCGKCHGHRGDAFCHTKVGPASYCKYWQADPAGRVCQYSNVQCDCQ